ncbi:MAG: beta-lactamase family protein [Bacteroidetes bacterium]|nr:beta-lactamase family protein [Bacteroidota bacterium]
MKKMILNFICLLTAGCVFAQDGQKEKNDAMKDKVVRYFNAQQADSLYSLAGEAFQKQLSHEAFIAVCNNNLFPLGEMKRVEFEKFDKNVSKYKTSFDAAIFSLYISLDDKGKLFTFLLQPYKKEITGPIIKSATDNAVTTAMDKKVDSIVQRFMFTSKTVGMSIGLLKDGKTYFYNYGETQKGNGKLPTNESVYEIGSVTKTFTATILAKAVTEHKINLSDPVNKYLPKDVPLLKFGNDTLKIVQLANHTSGLPPLPGNFGATDLINPYKDYDNDKLNAYLKTAKLLRKPGVQFEYCNLGVGLLGHILETIYQMPYEKMVTTFICSKAGMNNTRQFLLQKDSSFFVQGYNESILPNSQWDFKALAAAGCLRSNATDMLKYAALQTACSDKTLQAAITLTHQPTFNTGQQQIALNWFIQNWGSGDVLFHGGQTGGYKSFLAINPETKNAVIILANTTVSNDEIGVQLLHYIDQK